MADIWSKRTFVKQESTLFMSQIICLSHVLLRLVLSCDTARCFSWTFCTRKIRIIMNVSTTHVSDIMLAQDDSYLLFKNTGFPKLIFQVLMRRTTVIISLSKTHPLEVCLCFLQDNKHGWNVKLRGEDEGRWGK